MTDHKKDPSGRGKESGKYETGTATEAAQSGGVANYAGNIAGLSRLEKALKKSGV